MSKKLIAIPEGNLMRIAETKGLTNFSALKERTGVDRKTLRRINTGRPVKDTKLQEIADKLHVPIAHLLGPDAVDKSAHVSNNNAYRYREIRLQRLDAAALREFAVETGNINWFLKVDQMSDELEALLLRLRNSLNAWFEVGRGMFEPGTDDLENQISKIKTSANIDKSIEELAHHDLQICGGTYIAWENFGPNLNDAEGNLHTLPILTYRSTHALVLGVARKEKNISIVRINPGPEPPQTFTENELAGINFVYVDGVKVWSREAANERAASK